MRSISGGRCDSTCLPCVRARVRPARALIAALVLHVLQPQHIMQLARLMCFNITSTRQPGWPHYYCPTSSHPPSPSSLSTPTQQLQHTAQAVREPKAARGGLLAPFKGLVKESIGLVSDLTLRPAVAGVKAVGGAVTSVTVAPALAVTGAVSNALTEVAGDALAPASNWAHGAAQTLQNARREVRAATVFGPARPPA